MHIIPRTVTISLGTAESCLPVYDWRIKPLDTVRSFLLVGRCPPVYSTNVTGARYAFSASGAGRTVSDDFLKGRVRFWFSTSARSSAFRSAKCEGGDGGGGGSTGYSKKALVAGGRIRLLLFSAAVAGE